MLVFLQEEDRAELEDLNRRHMDFGSERSQVLAVLRVTAREARQIAEDMALTVPIIADASGAMARGYDAEDGGRRVAVVADEEGLLVRRFDPLPVVDDPSDVTDALLNEVRAIGSVDQEAGD